MTTPTTECEERISGYCLTVFVSWRAIVGICGLLNATSADSYTIIAHYVSMVIGTTAKSCKNGPDNIVVPEMVWILLPLLRDQLQAM